MIKISERKLRDIISEKLADAETGIDDETIEAITDDVIEAAKDDESDDANEDEE